MVDRRRIKFQLYELGSVGAFAKRAIQSSGGKVYVAGDGDAAKVAITDKDGVALTNPRALTQGGCEFYTLTTVERVDLFIQAPGGQFIVVPDVDESIADIGVDVTNPNQVYVIPFAIADTTAAAETDTGFDLIVGSEVMPTPAVKVSTLDATETIDVGILSSESGGDADGFVNAVVLDTAVMVKATLLASADTMGALLSVLDSANAGDDAPEPHVVAGDAVSISYTLTAGTDTAEGYIILPVRLSPV